MSKSTLAEQYIDEARKKTELEDFDSNSFREGLDILLEDMTRQGQPPIQDSFKDLVMVALVNRLKITDYLKKRPELLDRPIERPTFVFGVPRTGTTLLNNLLAADPAYRSPLAWEIDEPVPPATSATLFTDSRAVEKLKAHKELLDAIPQAGMYYRGSPVYPNECIFFMRSDFKALIFESTAKLPAYRDWLLQTDLTSTYEYHKRFLQVLQADAPGIWNLKMPSHALWLETLVKIYPDAQLIWTHRDPITATGSFCSLIHISQSVFSGAADMEWIAKDMPWQAAEHANRIMAFRDKFGEDRVIDVYYSDLMRTPIDAMRKLYAQLGRTFTADAEAGMQAWLDDNPQDKFGRHEYKLNTFGLTVDKVKPMFDQYLSRYDVEPEGF